MDIKAIEEVACRKMGKNNAHLHREIGHIYYHGLRTAKLALNLRKRLFPDLTQYDEHIYTGALFHDIGKGIDPHEETGYVIVKHMLADHCTKEELEIVSQIVRLHCKRKKESNYPIWVKIVQDADLLDHMGTMEIWLNFVIAAKTGNSIDYSIDWWKKDEHCAEVKNWGYKLNFDLSKEIWKEKISFVDRFIDRLAAENEGEFFI